MSGRLIALDKKLGVCPVCVGETWRQIFAKCVIKVTWPEANHACKDGQICAGLKVGIDGAVHRVQYVWDSNSTEENWVFLLIDAKTPLMRWIGS